MISRIAAPRGELRVAALLVLLSVVPAIAGAARLIELAVGGPITAANSRFFAMPLPVILHVLSVVPFSVLGALQFVPSLRHPAASWHRTVGRVLVVLAIVVALSGLWMANAYAWPEGEGAFLYVLRLVFGSAMLVEILLAIAALRDHDFAAHGAWMTRCYAIGMGAGTQVLTHLPYFMLAGRPGETSKALLMGGGWLINVVVAEWVLQRRATASLARQVPLPRRRSAAPQRSAP